MKLSLFFFLFCSSGLLMAQDLSPKDAQGKKHGLWRKSHENGKLRYEGKFEHGVPVGTFLHYFDNGQLRTKNVFRGKTGVCMSYQYGDKEILAAQGLYKNQEKDSIWTFYNLQGEVIGREPYVNGQLHGEARKYFPNGKLAELVTYNKGEKEGAWLQYYESGKKMAEGNYQSDKLQGECTYFYSSGKPRLRGEYRQGLMHGPWYYFGENLKLDKKEIWHYGRKVEKDKKDGESSSRP